ncbi:unnamed protein product [Cylicostephanus goldi]|uniref:Uncharacterized protein n=1 Tax=Cylicostephanus goldi TaxID=71465 RepID=A0A3P7QZH6_CYLGO|nr:unnamed protein product [Cylicostephanus goldi]
MAMAYSFIYNFALADYLHSQDPKLPEPNITTINNIINSSFRTDYLTDDHRFLALWRLGIITKKPQDLEISYHPVGGFILYNLVDHMHPVVSMLEKTQRGLDEAARYAMQKYGIELPEIQTEVLGGQYLSYLDTSQLKRDFTAKPVPEKKGVYKEMVKAIRDDKSVFSEAAVKRYRLFV